MKKFLTLICLAFLSCNGHVVFQERIDIENEQWSFDNALKYVFEIEDTSKAYGVIVDVEHSRNFGYQNIYSRIYTISPSGDTTSQRISIDLTDNMGQWLGTCKGNECSNQVMIQNQHQFSQQGSYNIILEQFSRSEVLEGVKSISLIITEIED